MFTGWQIQGLIYVKELEWKTPVKSEVSREESIQRTVAPAKEN